VETSEVAILGRDGVVEADKLHEHGGDEDEVFDVAGFVFKGHELVWGCFGAGAFGRGVLAYEGGRGGMGCRQWIAGCACFGGVAATAFSGQ
jgi:hypothetical protein